MAQKSITNTFGISNITLQVQEPTNVTNNDAFIAQKPWTETNDPRGVSDRSSKLKWYGGLMNCMELDWGYAHGINENNFKEMDESVIHNLLFGDSNNGGGIKTSDELIQVLCWLFKNRSQEPDLIKVSATQTTISATGDTTLKAVATGKADANTTNWEIFEGASYAFFNGNPKLTKTSGSSVKLTGKNTVYNTESANIDKQTITIDPTGSDTLTVTAAAITGKENQTVKVTATNVANIDGSPITITVNKPTSSAVKSYAWSITKGTEYASFNGSTTGASVTIKGKNTTTSKQEVIVQCTVTWDNNTNISKVSTVYVNGKAAPSATISTTTISRPKNSTLSDITWTGGSATSQIESGKTGTLTKGTVTAIYGNSEGTATITTSNIVGTLSITSSDDKVVQVGTINKNGTTTIKGLKPDTSTITVKDGSSVIETWKVTVKDETNTTNVTSSATFTPSLGSINGTTITAPTVSTNTDVTIQAKYGNKTATNTVKYTAKAATVYYWYAGQTKPTSMTSNPTVDDTNFTNNKWHTIGTTLTNIGKLVKGGVNGNTWYVAVPKDKYQPTADDLSTPDGTWAIVDTITVGTVQYSVYDTAIELNRCATYLKVK